MQRIDPSQVRYEIIPLILADTMKNVNPFQNAIRTLNVEFSAFRGDDALRRHPLQPLRVVVVAAELRSDGILTLVFRW
jgi:hypothetical protein